MAKILIADDEAELLELLRFSLDAGGFEVVAVNDGKKALDAAPDDPDALVSPADGRIIRAVPGSVSIFMNVFDVHICRTPVAGVVDTPDISATYPEAGWPYVDRNCDGVDGDLPSALFVWSGTDSSQGTLPSP